MKVDTVIIIGYAIMCASLAWMTCAVRRNWNVLAEQYPTLTEPACEPYFRRQQLEILFSKWGRYSGPMHIGVSAVGLFLKPPIEYWTRFRAILIPWDKIRAVTVRNKNDDHSDLKRTRSRYLVALGNAEVTLVVSEKVRGAIDPHIAHCTMNQSDQGQSGIALH